MRKSILPAFFLIGSALAHETSLAVSSSQVRAGEQVQVRGAGLGVHLRVLLSLEGTREIHSLGEVAGDEHGRFEITVTIPANAKPGIYTVKARADGNMASASVKVIQGGPAISQAPSPPSESAGTAATADHRAMGHGAPETPAVGMKHEVSTEPLQLNRSRTLGEAAVVWTAILVSALLGAMLWFRR